MKRSALSELGARTEAPPVSWLMATALTRRDLISLAAGFTDSATLPVSEVRQIVNELMRRPREGQAALQYGTTAGDPTLRRLTMERLRELDGDRTNGAAWSPERLLITNGSQQLLYILVEALCDPGDIVLVEDPTYFVFLGILQSHGIAARGVKTQADGLDLGHLDLVLQSLKTAGQLRKLKLLYLVSYYQNPTGITTSFEKKVGALRLLRCYEHAAGHPIYLVEDAAYRELRFSGPEVKSALAAAAQRERVIYIGTYSKPFATGIRAGFGLIPDPVLAPVLRIKANHDFGSSNLLQQVLARALESGRYKTHLGELRRRYAAKAGLMGQAIRKFFPPAVAWTEPQGGLYYWPRLPKGVRSGTQSRLFQSALDNGVFYVPGELCYAHEPTRQRPNHEMRLSFGAAGEAEITRGIQRLGKALHSLLD